MLAFGLLERNVVVECCFYDTEVLAGEVLLQVVHGALGASLASELHCLFGTVAIDNALPVGKGPVLYGLVPVVIHDDVFYVRSFHYFPLSLI